MATSLQIYELQVLQFLQSCTIAFSQIPTLQNTNLQNAGYTVDLTSPDTWKYYLNLSGQYHPTDTVMTITSLDTQQVVNFTPAMLAVSPKTQAAYTIGSLYYNTLCQMYPTQTDLIKSILYPVAMETALTAPDFTLLGWGNGYLEPDEQEAIIYEMNSFINYAANRWYFSFLNYECYYPWTFWASLWQTLPGAIFAARIKYLKTSYVHSFHIWNFLESQGISDYSDILTRQQSLFLYRNINYLIENRGTQANLVILVDNLLNNLSVGLVGKTIFMNTLTDAAICQWTPEFVSKIIPTENSQSLVIIAPESMTQLNQELVTAGLEVNNTAPYVEEQEEIIRNTTLNTLNTKLVEIQKLGIDQKYGSVLINFILDTLVSMITTNKYIAQFDIIDPTTNTSLSLDAKDALALYYYAVHRSGMEQPINLPVIYNPSCAFQYNITASEFPEVFKFGGFNYPTNSYLSIENMIAGISFPTTPINNAEDFSALVSTLFLNLIQNIRYSRTQSDYITSEMFLTYMKKYVLQTTPYAISLSSHTDYASWASSLNLTSLFATLDANFDYQSAYSNLATAISTALVPSDQSIVFSYFGYTPESVDNVYDRLKALFAQLCSYNIAFLDTNRVNTWWFLSDPILSSITGITDNSEIAFNPVTGLPDVSQIDQIPINVDATIREISISISDSVTQNLIESDSLTIGAMTDSSLIVNPFHLTPQKQNDTDTVIIINPIVLCPVFISSTTTP